MDSPFCNLTAEYTITNLQFNKTITNQRMCGVSDADIRTR